MPFRANMYVYALKQTSPSVLFGGVMPAHHSRAVLSNHSLELTPIEESLSQGEQHPLPLLIAFTPGSQMQSQNISDARFYMEVAKILLSQTGDPIKLKHNMKNHHPLLNCNIH